MSFLKPKAPKFTPIAPQIPVAAPPEIPPAPPTIQAPEVKAAEMDVLERQRRKRARAASQVVEPGFLTPAPTQRPKLKGVLG